MGLGCAVNADTKNNFFDAFVVNLAKDFVLLFMVYFNSDNIAA